MDSSLTQQRTTDVPQQSDGHTTHHVEDKGLDKNFLISNKFILFGIYKKPNIAGHAGDFSGDNGGDNDDDDDDDNDSDD